MERQTAGTEAPPDALVDTEEERAIAPRRRRRRRRVVLVCGFVVVLPGLLLFGSQLGRDPSLVASPLLGKKAPAFSLPRFDQPGRISSSDLSGRVAIINFWASWCVPCREETPVLEDFYRRHVGGVELVGILYNDTTQAALEFRRQLGGSWPLVDDPGGVAAINYGVFGVPETYVVDESGVIKAKLVGAVRRGTLDDVVARLHQVGSVYQKNGAYRTSPQSR